MTSVLCMLKPFDISGEDTHLAVLPFNRTFARCQSSILSFRTSLLFENELDCSRTVLNNANAPIHRFADIYGLTKLLHWPVVIGSPVVILPKFDLEPFCSLVEKYRATVCLLVPPIALLLAREPVVDKYDMSSLRLIISGAAPLGSELEGQLGKRLKTNVAQAYGLTGESAGVLARESESVADHVRRRYRVITCTFHVVVDLLISLLT